MGAPQKTRQWILAKKPKDKPEDDTFKLVEESLPELKDDQVLVKLLYLSNDPAQRGWIQLGAKPERLYVPPVKEGEIMRAAGIGTVVTSRSDKVPTGTLVSGNIGWAEYRVLDARSVLPIEKVGELSETQFLGAFGMTGITAYYGLSVVRASADDTVVVSGAAGATGSMVVQIAKHLLGCKRVVGIAGSEEKCRWVESLGADVCVNYKADSFREELKRATDGFVEVYFDNVGGKILEMMLGRLKKYGRVAACGEIANYNAATNPEPIRNWFEIISNRLEIKGFIVFDIMKEQGPEITKKLIQAYKDGKVKIGTENETVVDTDFESVPKTWQKLFSGGNTGKLVTKLV